MLKIFRSCPSRLKSCAYLFTHEQPWGHYPNRMHTCTCMILNMQKTQNCSFWTRAFSRFFRNSSHLPSDVEMAFNSQRCFISVFDDNTDGQCPSLGCHWWKRFCSLSKGNFLRKGGGTQQHFSCNALTDCKMFFKPFDSECNSSRCGCNCLDISSLFCSLAAAALPPQTACVLPSLLFGLQGQRWLSEIKLWNHIFRQDQMLSVSAFDMTARFVTQPTYFQRCCCQPSPDIGFSVAMPPSTILFFFLYSSKAHYCWLDVQLQTLQCVPVNWDGPQKLYVQCLYPDLQSWVDKSNFVYSYIST